MNPTSAKHRTVALIVPALPEMRVTRERPLRHNRLFALPYLGPRMLAAVTPEAFELRILNEHLVPVDPTQVEADLVGITVMTPLAPRAYELADAWRSRGTPVVLGGIHPTALPNEALAHADSVVLGEAEETWPQLLRDFEARCLRRLYPRRAPSNLADLPLPLRNGCDHRKRAIEVAQATRGCVHRCTFCPVHRLYDGTFRTRPVDHVVEELRGLPGRLFTFVDDNLAAKHDWAKALFEAMAPLKKRWVSMASLAVAEDEELLRLARRSGCMGFFVGLESLDESNLVASRKPFSRAMRKDLRRAIGRMHAYGLGVSAGTIFGFDNDKPRVFQEMLDFAREVRLNVLQVAPLTPFPGTELHDQWTREGRDLDTDWSRYNYYDVVFTPRSMSRDALLSGMNRLRREFYAMSSIFRRVLGNAPALGPYSTLLNSALNLSYRRYQRRGFRYPP